MYMLCDVKFKALTGDVSHDPLMSFWRPEQLPTSIKGTTQLVKNQLLSEIESN